MHARKVIIFDWDGTLANSSAAVFRTIKRLISEFNYPVLSEEQISLNLGLSMRDFARKLWDVEREQLPAFLKVFYRVYEEEEGKDDQMLYPGAKEVLEYFKQQGFSLAIATNRIRHRLDRAVKLTQLQNFFDFTVTADEALEKPHPLMMEQILAFFKVSLENICMVGDSSYDAIFAQNTGIRAFIINHQSRSPAFFGNFKKLKILPNLRALLAEVL